MVEALTLRLDIVAANIDVISCHTSCSKVAEVQRMACDLGITCVTALKMDATRALIGSSDDATLGAISPGSSDSSSNSSDFSSNSDGSSSSHSSIRSNCSSAADRSNSSGGGGSEAGAQCSASASSQSSVPSVPAGDKADSHPGFEPESFDYVLLDAPCSALGLRPRLLHDWTQPRLDSLAGYQRALLATAVQLLKPGGSLVYCTCTINPGENEGNAAYALRRWKGCLELAPQPIVIGQPGLVGTPWADLGIASGASGLRQDELGVAGLTVAEAGLVQRFYPGDDGASSSSGDDTMGFFIAKFVKTKSTLA